MPPLQLEKKYKYFFSKLKMGNLGEKHAPERNFDPQHLFIVNRPISTYSNSNLAPNENKKKLFIHPSPRGGLFFSM